MDCLPLFKDMTAAILYNLSLARRPTQPVVVSQFQAFLANIVNVTETNYMRSNLALRLKPLIFLLRADMTQVQIKNFFRVSRRQPPFHVKELAERVVRN